MDYVGWIKKANQFDLSGDYEQADRIDFYLRKASIEDEGGLSGGKDVDPQIIGLINQNPLGDNYTGNPFHGQQPKHRGPERPSFVDEMSDEQVNQMMGDLSAGIYDDGDNDDDIPEEFEQAFEMKWKDMRNIAGMYYDGQSDPLYAFNSSGFFMDVTQRNDAIYNLEKDRDHFSSHSQEYKEITDLANYLHTLTPIAFKNDGQWNFDYLEYAYGTLGTENEDGIQDFVINIPNSHFWALSGSITGQLKDGEVVAFQSQVGVEGTTPVEPYLDNDTVMALLDNVLIH